MTERTPIETRKTHQEIAAQIQRISAKLGQRALRAVREQPEELGKDLYSFGLSQDRQLADYDRGVETRMLGAKKSEKDMRMSAHVRNQQGTIEDPIGVDSAGEPYTDDSDIWVTTKPSGEIRLQKNITDRRREGKIDINVSERGTLSGTINESWTDQYGNGDTHSLNQAQMIKASANMLAGVRDHTARAEIHAAAPPPVAPLPNVSGAGEMLDSML